VEVPSDHDILLALGEDLPVGVWIARAPDGALIYANRMFVDIVGARPPDRCQVGCSERYGLFTRDGNRYPETRLPFPRALNEGCAVEIDDLTIRRRDGKRIDVRAVARPVGEPITHVVTTLFDVSREVASERARLETEQRLRRAQRLEAIGTLAGGIAHDFNNLIFGVKLITAELGTGETDPKRRVALDQLDEITERSAALTRSLISFTRRGEQRAMPVSVSDVVTAMSELLTRTLSGVELSLELDATDRGTVIADQTQLEQVVMSLVLNARGAAHVVVRTGDVMTPGYPEPARFVALEVMDDGPGLLSEPRPAEPAPGGGDHTLDLAAVFGIVERHGGSVEVDAGLDGRGTTMRVLLPAARRASAARSRPSVADLPRGSGLILVVDDDRMVRKVVSSSLSSLGYQVVEAVSGSDAVDIYRARHAEIRAVVLDMVMQGMTGRATYLALRDIDRNVAVLLMSGHTLNEQVQEILDLGVRGFVSKPYSIAVLAAAMVDLTR
jgi:CheY-like chemotaxis protein